MPTTLYQFPISHYCEKARWALDYKGVNYRIKNLLPGLHVKPLQRLCGESTVPMLSMQGQHIQNSDRIIDFLDAQIAHKPLTPRDAAVREQALHWENFAAEKIGDPLRLYFYHYLLNHPRVVIDRFTQSGPWYGKLFYAVAFPRVSARIRRGYHISPRTADIARHIIDKALLKLEQHLQSQSFLAGDSFSRADLSVCALLSPLVMPPTGSARAKNYLPEEIHQLRAQYLPSPIFAWVNAVYARYR
jgi:glutathione S-transferase